MFRYKNQIWFFQTNMILILKMFLKDEMTGEMIKGVGDRVIDWIWKLYNMVFQNGVMTEDWRSVIVPQHKGKEREMNVRILEVLAY